MRSFRILMIYAFIAGLLWPACGCSKKPSANSNDASSNDAPSASIDQEREDGESDIQKAIQDEPLSDNQIKLMDWAVEAAESIAKEPYIKDRARVQEGGVDTYLALEQPIKATRLADRIENWRRGLCYANVALYLADKGYAAEQIKPGLELAERIAALDHGQKWRSDRIRSKIALVYYLLEQHEAADKHAQDLDASESGRLVEYTAQTLAADQFESHVQTLNKQLDIGNYDGVDAALYAYTELFNRFYDDIEKRELAETTIKASWHKVPVLNRVQLLIEMVQFANRHNDHPNAERLIREAYVFVTDEWALHESIPVYSKLIESRHTAGDTEGAIRDTDTALSLYNQKIAGELVIYKGKILRPLAEACISIGRVSQGTALYKRLLNEISGISNPRIRAEDLSAFCCSMALCEVHPDEQLWGHIRSVLDGLRRL